MLPPLAALEYLERGYANDGDIEVFRRGSLPSFGYLFSSLLLGV